MRVKRATPAQRVRLEALVSPARLNLRSSDTGPGLYRQSPAAAALTGRVRLVDLRVLAMWRSLAAVIPLRTLS